MDEPYKSRAERNIARCLSDHRVPFVYERPTAVMDDGKLRLYYPDFSLQTGLIIEYFGVRDDPGYAARSRHKLGVYAANRYPVIPLYPHDLCGAWETNLLTRIDSSLENALVDFRRSAGRFPGIGWRQRFDSRPDAPFALSGE